MATQSERIQRLLREAREAVEDLRLDGRNVRALELELRRGERAVEDGDWEEARRHLDRVRRRAEEDRSEREDDADDDAAIDVPVPVAASRAGSRELTTSSVHEKLDLSRRRIEVLKRFGVDIEGMQASLARAEDFLAGQYVASAESIADELLVLTKAAAEGVRRLAAPPQQVFREEPGRPAPGAGHNDDFIVVLQRAVTDLAGARGWLTAPEVRTLIDETLPKFYLLERHVAEQLHRAESDAAKAVHDLRSDLGGALAEKTAALQAALTAVRDDGGPALARTRDELQALAGRAEALAQALAGAEDAIRRLDALEAEQERALQAATAELEEHRGRLDRAADGAELEELAKTVAGLRDAQRAVAPQTALDALRTRLDEAFAELRRLADDGARARGDLRADAERLVAAVTERAGALEAKLDTLAAGQARLANRVAEAEEQGQVLVGLESAVDDLRLWRKSGPEPAQLADRLAALKGELERALAGKADLAAVRDLQEEATARGAAADALQEAEVAALREAQQAVAQRLAACETALAEAGGHAVAAAELRQRLEALPASERLDALSGELAALRGELAQKAEATALAEAALDYTNLRSALTRLASGERVDSLAGELAALTREVAGVRSATEAKADTARLDALAAELAALHAAREQTAEGTAALQRELAARPDATRLDALAGEIAALRDQLAAKADAADTAATERELAGLRGAIARLAAADRVEALAAELAALRSAAGSAADAGRVQALADGLGELRAQLSGKVDAGRVAALEEAVRSGLPGKAGADELAALEARIAEFETRIRGHAETASRAVPILETSLGERIESLAERVSAAEAALQQRAGAFDERLAVLAPRIAAGEGAARETAALAERIDALAKRFAATEGAAQDATRAIDRLRTETRDAEATQGAAIGALAQRLDNATETMEALAARLGESRAADPAIARITEEVRDLAAAVVAVRAEAEQARTDADTRLRELAQRPAGDPVLAQEIAALRAGAAASRGALDEQLAEIAARLARVEAAPRHAATPADGDALRGALERIAVLERDLVNAADAAAVQSFAAEVQRTAVQPAAEALKAVAELRDALTARSAGGDAAALAERLAAAERAADERLGALERHHADGGVVVRVAARVATLAEQLEAAERIVTERLDALEARPADALAGRISVLEQRVAALAETPSGDLAERIARLERQMQETARSGDQTSRFAALAGRVDDIARHVSSSGSTSGGDTERLAALVHRVDDLARHLPEIDGQALLRRIEALEKGGPAAPRIDEHQLAHLVQEKVMERMKQLVPDLERLIASLRKEHETMRHAPASALDAGAVRKLLPSLLSEPEASGVIINTVLIEALSGKSLLGEASALKQLIREEVRRVAGDLPTTPAAGAAGDDLEVRVVRTPHPTRPAQPQVVKPVVVPAVQPQVVIRPPPQPQIVKPAAPVQPQIVKPEPKPVQPPAKPPGQGGKPGDKVFEPFKKP